MSKRLKGTGKRSKSNVSSNSHSFAKKCKDIYDFKMTEALLLEGLKNKIKEAWYSKETKDFELNDNAVTMIKHPFNCLVMKNLLSNGALIEGLVDELHDQKFAPKNNDLYKFAQSCDLRSNQSSAIQGLRSFLFNHVKPWLEDVTGISLSENIDMFCAKYEHTDYLLCHDDELQGMLCQGLYIY